MRKARGWSIDELAFRSHISPRLIGGYERGEGTPRVVHIERLCAALEVPLPWFDLPDEGTARYLGRLTPALGPNLVIASG